MAIGLSTHLERKAIVFLERTVLFLPTMMVVHNLANLCFSNLRSSYRFGAKIIISGVIYKSCEDWILKKNTIFLLGIAAVQVLVSLFCHFPPSLPFLIPAHSQPSASPLELTNQVSALSNLPTGCETIVIKEGYFELDWIANSFDMQHWKGYQCYYVKGTIDPPKLQAFLNKNPRVVIFTEIDCFVGLKIPSLAYIFRVCPSMPNKNTKCIHRSFGELKALSICSYLKLIEQDMSWPSIWSDEAKQGFVTMCLQLYQFLTPYDTDQKVHFKSYKELFHQLNNKRTKLPSKILLSLTDIFQPLHSILLDNYSLKPWMVMRIAKSIHTALKIESPYQPLKMLRLPDWAQEIKLEKCDVCQRQGRQILEVLKGPHHLVLIGPEKQRSTILSHLNLETDWKYIQINKKDTPTNLVVHLSALLDFVYSHPKTLIFCQFSQELTKDLKSSFDSFMSSLPQETKIVISYPLEFIQKEREESLNLFSPVYLLPFDESECLKEISQIDSQSKKPLSEQVRQAAVAMVFLFLQEKGDAIAFIQDLMERTRTYMDPNVITIQSLWTTFQGLYPGWERQLALSADVFMKKEDVEAQQSRSLAEIGREIEKKFRVKLEIPKKEIALPAFLTNLNEQMKGKPDPTLGNETNWELLEKTASIPYVNLLLIGKAGVGKTTLVESVAWKLANNKIKKTSPFFGATIFSLDVNGLMANTKYVGSLEKKIEDLVAFLQTSPNSILFIDEIHRVIGAGASKGNEMGTVAQHLKPYLTNAAFSRVIGATTEDEKNKFMTQETAFMRRFHEISVLEPTAEQLNIMLHSYLLSEEVRQAFSKAKVSEHLVKYIIDSTNKIKNPHIGQPHHAKVVLQKALASAIGRQGSQEITQDDVNWALTEWKKSLQPSPFHS